MDKQKILEEILEFYIIENQRERKEFKAKLFDNGKIYGDLSLEEIEKIEYHNNIELFLVKKLLEL